MSAKLKLATFKSEAEERKFWEANDSAKLVDWSKAERVRLPNLKPTTQSISLRLPLHTLERIKAAGFRDAVHVHGGVSAWVRQIDPSLPAY